MSALEQKILGGEAASVTYAEAKELARHPDQSVRKALALRRDLPPELLYFLSQDPVPEVRSAAAANAALPHQADLVLADDSDHTVRSGLAAKIAKAAPGLTANEHDKVRRSAYDTLQKLAQDQVAVVRQILAETLKDVADAPAEVINRLARDTELAVSGPILENSPVLTDEDLVEIIRQGPAQGGIGAISRRRNVSETVADAVVATDDVEAIADLLGNPSAQIREETLDNLIERAPEIELWHAPLVGRPKLPPQAAARLAQFVADNMLDVLQARADLDPATLAAVKSAVHERVKGGRPAPARTPPPPRPESQGPRPDFLKVEPPITVAKRLYQAGKLDNKVVAKALHASDHAFVVAALMVRADQPMKVMRHVFNAKDAKGIVAVCWKAGVPMKLAEQVQQRMARLNQDEVIHAKGDNEYPLGEPEMTALLDALREAPEAGG